MQADTLKSLTEGVHTREALDMVKDHVKNVMGPAAAAYANTMLKMSKLQAAQVHRRQRCRASRLMCSYVQTRAIGRRRVVLSQHHRTVRCQQSCPALIAAAKLP